MQAEAPAEGSASLSVPEYWKPVRWKVEQISSWQSFDLENKNMVLCRLCLSELCLLLLNQSISQPCSLQGKEGSVLRLATLIM